LLPVQKSDRSEASTPRQLADADGVSTLFGRALSAQRAGASGEAVALYSQILALHPEHAPSLHLCGTLSLQAGSIAEAIDLLTRSLAANPNVPAAHLDLANALRFAKRIPEALASYDRAIAIKTDFLEAYFNKAIVLQEFGRTEDALKCYEGTLKIRPDFLPALFNRAVLLAQAGRSRDALEAYERCLRIAPGHVESLSNRASLLLALGRAAEALPGFDQALRHEPHAAAVLNNRGNALVALQRVEEGIVSFDRALALDPAYFECWRNRGGALRRLGATDAAAASFGRALALRPDDPATLRDLAETKLDAHRYTDAMADLERCLAVAPDTDYLAGLRLHIQGLACDWGRYADRAAALAAEVSAGRRADYPFPFLAVIDSPSLQARCAASFAEAKFPSPARPLWRGKPYRHPKLRLAYLSADLGDHALSALMVRVFELHDRDRFATTAVSLRPPQSSPLGVRVHSAFDDFLDVSHLSDTAVAELLRAREIDVLVDLMGYTKGARTGILALRPAPVQVHYLGFPGTMGAPFMDYLIADRFVVPDSQRGAYCEKIIYLPECFQANDDQRIKPHVSSPRRRWDLPEIGFVFASFNNSYKLNPRCFEVWMDLLRSVPASVLWLLADDHAVRGHLQAAAAAAGVDSRRLIFAGRVSYAEHLARLPCADLVLDTFPFNGGTSASDALWAGVPLLTLAGDAFAARMAGSLLNALDLPELITGSLERYRACALELATQPNRLSEIRTRLAVAHERAPLFDSARFCRHLESAFESIRERAERRQPPADTNVAALPRQPH